MRFRLPIFLLLTGSILPMGLVHFIAGRQETPTNPLSSPSIGLDIGQRAPSFALSDQFGKEQSNESLKGLKGTVLLFFRSADW